MAPEQLHGHDQLDERTDVFLLGAMLHQILTGQPPRDAAHPAPSDPRAPPELSRIALKAMAHAPADRYPSVVALMHEIRSFAVRNLFSSRRT
jgi:serine/threonine-protein kinase